MSFIEIQTCSNSLGPKKETKEDPYWTLTATPNGAGGDVLDQLEDPYSVNVFEKNMTRLESVINSLCEKESVETFKITGFKARPYFLKGKEMRVFRTPIPCEWVGGDESRALQIAIKLVGCKNYDNEEDAKAAWDEKTGINVEAAVEQQVDPGF